MVCQIRDLRNTQELRIQEIGSCSSCSVVSLGSGHGVKYSFHLNEKINKLNVFYLPLDNCLKY